MRQPPHCLDSVLHVGGACGGLVGGAVRLPAPGSKPDSSAGRMPCPAAGFYCHAGEVNVHHASTSFANNILVVTGPAWDQQAAAQLLPPMLRPIMDAPWTRQ